MSRYILEALENRALLANAPDISIAQRSLYFNAIQETSDTQVLRITNNGTANVDLKPGSVYVLGSHKAQFTTNMPAEGKAIKPGYRFDLEVTFTALDNDTNVNVARLIILSNDPDSPGITVGLRGLPTAGEGGSLEPSLQRVIDTFGLPINVGDANPDDYLLGTPTADSDEVQIQALQKADPDKVVSIRPLAMFGVKSGPAVRLGYYSPGQTESLKELWYVPVESGQSVNPIVYGQTLVNPGDGPFALFTQWPGFYNPDGTQRIVYQEDGLNATWETSASKTRKMRFYPFVDQFGNAAPNTYLVAIEEYTQDYDNQDLLFIVSNVMPAADKPTVAATANFMVPSNHRLVFNEVEIDDVNYPNATRTTQTVKVRNTGTQTLTASFDTTGSFSITAGGGTDVSIAPGSSRTVTITFTASSGTTHTGTFTITSNDPDNPTITYDLVGYWQEYSEFPPGQPSNSVEPSSKTIVNTLFGFTTNLTDSGQSLSTGGQVRTTGDEILSPYWKQADDNAVVRVTQLASFHNQTYQDVDLNYFPTQAYISWYEQGSPGTSKKIFTHAAGDGQTVLPRENGNLSGISSGAFKAENKTFGFLVEGTEYSDPTLNPDILDRDGYGHFVRFWPAYDEEGKLMPNTYIMLHDYNRSFTNYDFNDNIYLIQNIKPVPDVKSVLTVFTEETSKGARISFTSPATGPRIEGFNVYRSTTPRGGYALLNDTPLARRPVTTYIDETSTASDTFYYQITAVGEGGVESQPVTVYI